MSCRRNGTIGYDGRQGTVLLDNASEPPTQDSHTTWKRFSSETGKDRRKYLKYFLLIVACISMAVALSVAALAATGNLDMVIFNSWSNTNPETHISELGTSPHIPTNAKEKLTVTGNGEDLVIEPIEGFIDGRGVYTQLKLTARSDKPLPKALVFVRIKEGRKGTQIDNGLEINAVDDYTAIVNLWTIIDFLRYDEESNTLHVCFDLVASEDAWNNYSLLDLEDEVFWRFWHDSEYVKETYFGNWEVILSADAVIDTVFLEGAFEGRDAQVAISATRVNIRIFGDENDPYIIDSTGVVYKHDIEGAIAITLNNGETIEVFGIESEAGVGASDFGVAEYWGKLDFINPQDVICVELFGETIAAKPDEQ